MLKLPHSSATTLTGVQSADGFEAYVYLPLDQISIVRDSSGAISTVNFRTGPSYPATLTINRTNGVISSVTVAIPADSFTQTQNITRSANGSISGVTLT